MRFAWLAPLAAACLFAQSNGDWPMYNHDLAGTRYSPLTQINAKNVAALKQAWVYRLRSPADATRRLSGIGGFSEATPIVVNDDVDSQRFMDTAIPAIYGHWDVKALAAVADKSVYTPERLSRARERFAGWSVSYGPMVTYHSAKGITRIGF